MTIQAPVFRHRKSRAIKRPADSFFGGSEGIRPTSLSAVSVVKRNATLFRLPEAVDVQRIPSGKATNKKRHDRFCQALFFGCATFDGCAELAEAKGFEPLYRLGR